jgi:hypothetical protein
MGDKKENIDCYLKAVHAACRNSGKPDKNDPTGLSVYWIVTDFSIPEMLPHTYGNVIKIDKLKTEHRLLKHIL